MRIVWDVQDAPISGWIYPDRQGLLDTVPLPSCVVQESHSVPTGQPTTFRMGTTVSGRVQPTRAGSDRGWLPGHCQLVHGFAHHWVHRHVSDRAQTTR
jgi:hypothetical protein